jgi:hypothetical protein
MRDRSAPSLLIKVEDRICSSLVAVYGDTIKWDCAFMD